MRVSFTVPGHPVPQGAVKTFIAGGRARGRHANATQLQDYRARIAMAAEQAMAFAGAHAGQLMDTPVALEVTFWVPRPLAHFGTGRNSGKLKGSAPRYPGTRPDLSHLIRALEDGLTGVVIRDDSLVAEIVAAKEYADEEVPPCTSVTIGLLPVTVGASEPVDREEEAS